MAKKQKSLTEMFSAETISRRVKNAPLLDENGNPTRRNYIVGLQPEKEEEPVFTKGGKPYFLRDILYMHKSGQFVPEGYESYWLDGKIYNAGDEVNENNVDIRPITTE